MCFADGAIHTPAELARRLGVNVRLASYHVHVLTDAGLVRALGARPARGMVAHEYVMAAENGNLLSTLLGKPDW
jgi:DNA-binding transcriptional ArsR family regulator